jgi:glucose-1-phosphate thymidylyltransferase
MKGLILSGGKGTRLRPITYTSAKQLVPVGNKPVLFRVIEALVEAGITDIGIVVGDTGPEIKAAVGDGDRFGANITYIQQQAPLGLADGVRVSQSFLGDQRFVMFLGDNVIQGGISTLIREFETCDLDCQIVLKHVQNPQQYGVAELDDGGRIIRLVEKPREPKSDLALVGIYMFTPAVHEAVRSITPSWRGEWEITDAIQWLVAHQYKVYPYVHQGWWIDTGKMEDLLEANRLVLDEIEPQMLGFADRDSRLIGKVTLEKGAQVVNSVVRGPAIIGEETRLVNAYVGPFTSIYHHCTVQNAEIEHSIVLEHCSIVDVGHRIEDSLIGRNVEIVRSPLKPRALKLILGDNSRVGLVGNGQ